MSSSRAAVFPGLSQLTLFLACFQMMICSNSFTIHFLMPSWIGLRVSAIRKIPKDVTMYQSWVARFREAPATNFFILVCRITIPQRWPTDYFIPCYIDSVADVHVITS
mmetsp:Transcript_29182/g.56828  ORF Transcript_29182/g.56828 Transcript_29182/m.56828 type:complete len:108 (-) Transcript_29182:29-352(-)